MRKSFGSLVCAMGRKPVQEAKLKPVTFDGFRNAYRPDMAYNGGYAYLQEPIRRVLEGRDIVVMKGSQVGVTELLLSFTLFWLVVEQKSIFYMLPTDGEVGDFSAARFNPVIDESDALSKLFSYDNVHHKRVGKANLYLRGGQAPGGRPSSKMKQVSVSKLVLDEYDEIPTETLAIVRERLSGSLDKQVISMSTPTELTRGIAVEYEQSEKHQYFLSCVHCGRPQTMTFEDNLDLAGQTYRCASCKGNWTHEQKVAMVAGGAWRRLEGDCSSKALGFHIPQLLSPSITAPEICDLYSRADSELKKQAFFNHKLGLPYTAEGSRLSPDLVNQRVGEYAGGNALVAGIDVSSGGLHYCAICQTCEHGLIVRRILRVSWGDLPGLLTREKIAVAVIDFQPERSKAQEFVAAWNQGLGYKALYPNGLQCHYVLDNENRIVKIHRTMAIDGVLERFRADHILIDKAVAQGNEFEAFRLHCCAVSRQYRESKGEYEAYYTETGADHYLHALVYADVAGHVSGGYRARREEYDEDGGNFLTGRI